MQIANLAVMYLATESVCFRKGENGELHYEGLMIPSNTSENTYTRRIKDLTTEEYLTVERSNIIDKKKVICTFQMLELYKSAENYLELYKSEKMENLN